MKETGYNLIRLQVLSVPSVRGTRKRSSNVGWCSGLSGTAAFRLKACRTTNAILRSRTKGKATVGGKGRNDKRLGHCASVLDSTKQKRIRISARPSIPLCSLISYAGEGCWGCLACTAAGGLVVVQAASLVRIYRMLDRWSLLSSRMSGDIGCNLYLCRHSLLQKSLDAQKRTKMCWWVTETSTAVGGA